MTACARRRAVGIRVRTAVTGVMFGLVACSGAPPPHPPPHPSGPTSANTPSSASASLPARTLAWSDEFDGPAGSAPDPSTWTPEVGGHGWGNDELQYYTAGTGNAALDGRGRLVVSARRAQTRASCWYGPCRYTSARLTTYGKRSWTYGRLEATVWAPKGAGLWPAFWMLGDDVHRVPYPQGGEIDIMEIVGDQPGESWASLHGPGFVRADLTRAFRPRAGDLASGFHTYAVDRSPDAVTFAVDGRVYYRVTRGEVTARGGWVFDKPFHALLNVAVGGDWPKTPPPGTRLPAAMIVDRVAYYR